MEEHSRCKAAGRVTIAEAWQNRRTRGWVPLDQTVWGQRGRREEGWVLGECHLNLQKKVLGRGMTNPGLHDRRQACSSSAETGLGRDERHQGS